MVRFAGRRQPRMVLRSSALVRVSRSIVAFLFAVLIAVIVAVAWWGLSLDPSEPQRLRRSLTVTLNAFLHTIPALLLSLLSISGFPGRVVRWLRLPTASRRQACKVWLARSFRGGFLRLIGLNFVAQQTARLAIGLYHRDVREMLRPLSENWSVWLVVVLVFQALVLARLTARGHVREATCQPSSVKHL
jgi:energy-converting hydrogenase Eha subunit A